MNPMIAFLVTAALVYRAYLHQSLTTLGIFVAALTALVHALHPWSVFFVLLCTFFLAGTAATKVKTDVKAGLTLHEASPAKTRGGRDENRKAGGEGPRTHIQVLANSGTASVLILLHLHFLYQDERGYRESISSWGPKRDMIATLLPFGIIGQYAAVLADTLSSELGILSGSQPVMITNPWKRAPPGTNGGVTLFGTLAGVLGGLLIGITAAILTPFDTSWTWAAKARFVAFNTAIGAVGTALDSLLGAIFQQTIVDRESGKVIEGRGGVNALLRETSSKLGGNGFLDNNAVNFAMASSMAGAAIGLAPYAL